MSEAADFVCPECTYSGPRALDGACPKCREQNPDAPEFAIAAPRAALPVRVLDAATYEVARIAGEIGAVAWRGVAGALAVGSGVAILSLLDALLRDIGTAFFYGFFHPGPFSLMGVFLVPIFHTLWTAAACVPPGVVGWFALEQARGREGRARRVGIDDAWSEVVTLRGRPGLAVYLSIHRDDLEDDERPDIVLRLRRAAGDWVGARLGRFRGPWGEARVRQRCPDHRHGHGLFLEVGAFLPVLALELRPEDLGETLTAEALLFVDGESTAEVTLEVRVPDSPDILPPALAAAADPLVEFAAAPADLAGALCGVCGDVLADPMVTCGSCETAHHPECWAFVGRCSTYACEGLAEPRRPSLASAAEGAAEGSAGSHDLVWAESRRAVDVLGLARRRGAPVPFPTVHVPRRPGGWRRNRILRGTHLLVQGTLPFLPVVFLHEVGGLGVAAIAFLAVLGRYGAEELGERFVRALDTYMLEFPRGDLRSFHSHLLLRHRDARWVGEELVVEALALARDLAAEDLRASARVRLGGGSYVRAAGEEGRFGELEFRLRAGPVEIARARACRLEVRLPLAAALREAARASGDRDAGLDLPDGAVVVEVVLLVRDRVLAEIDAPLPPGPLPPADGPPGDPALTLEALTPLAASKEHAAGDLCVLCLQAAGDRDPRCATCRGRHHPECQGFAGGCARCG